MNRGHEVLAEGSEAIGERTFGVAHGLALNLNRPLSGLHPHAPMPLPEVFVDVGPRHEVLASSHRGRGAHRVRLPGCATAVIDADGRRIALVPDGDGHGWPRMLAARALPHAALIRGYEVLNGTAVVRDGLATVLVGPPGAGKSAVAGHLVLSGAQLLADEVVALDRDSRTRLRAHPGLGVLHVRSGGTTELAKAGLAFRNDAALLPVAPAPVPVAAVLILERADIDHMEITRVREPARLMPWTFSLNLSSSERLKRHFAIRESLVSGGGLHHVRAPTGMSAAEIASSLNFT